MAQTASLVAVHRELLVVHHRLAEQLDLLRDVVWRRGEPGERPCFDAVDLGLDLDKFLLRARRQSGAVLFRARRAGGSAKYGGENSHRDGQESTRRLHLRILRWPAPSGANQYRTAPGGDAPKSRCYEAEPSCGAQRQVDRRIGRPRIGRQGHG